MLVLDRICANVPYVQGGEVETWDSRVEMSMVPGSQPTPTPLSFQQLLGRLAAPDEPPGLLPGERGELGEVEEGKMGVRGVLPPIIVELDGRALPAMLASWMGTTVAGIAPKIAVELGLGLAGLQAPQYCGCGLAWTRLTKERKNGKE